MEYLGRVSEVKDTVHKQTLLSHVANIVLDQFPDTTDLYSDVGSVTRCAKVRHLLGLFVDTGRIPLIHIVLNHVSNKMLFVTIT